MARCYHCDGFGYFYGPSRGVAGCETDKYECEDCGGTGYGPCDYCAGPNSTDSDYCSDDCHARAQEEHVACEQTDRDRDAEHINAA